MEKSEDNAFRTVCTILNISRWDFFFLFMNLRHIIVNLVQKYFLRLSSWVFVLFLVHIIIDFLAEHLTTFDVIGGLDIICNILSF